MATEIHGRRGVHKTVGTVNEPSSLIPHPNRLSSCLGSGSLGASGQLAPRQRGFRQPAAVLEGVPEVHKRRAVIRPVSQRLPVGDHRLIMAPLRLKTVPRLWCASASAGSNSIIDRNARSASSSVP